MIRAGANINAVDNDGWTPLHAAAHWDKHDVIRFLLDRNADLDAKNYAVSYFEDLRTLKSSSNDDDIEFRVKRHWMSVMVLLMIYSKKSKISDLRLSK